MFDVMQIMSAINKWLDGKKVVIAGIGALGAFLCVVSAQLNDGFTFSDLKPICVAFSAMMLVFGSGHKLEKINKGLKALNKGNVS